jgi:hypothetical protein
MKANEVLRSTAKAAGKLRPQRDPPFPGLQLLPAKLYDQDRVFTGESDENNESIWYIYCYY